VIPGRGESELAIGGDNDIGHEMVVSVEDALGVTVRVLIAGQLPDNDGLVYYIRRKLERVQKVE
jgi:hypothetical protein